MEHTLIEKLEHINRLMKNGQYLDARRWNEDLIFYIKERSNEAKAVRQNEQTQEVCKCGNSDVIVVCDNCLDDMVRQGS